ncbi:Spo7-domain-containing protein, partial [Patellaria atrata CBS 101060]
LDQIVKGTPPPNVTVPEVAAAAHVPPSAHDRITAPRPPKSPSDPTSLLPSSPPQIYLNLLILEASLRAQFLTLRARRRQNTFVLTALGIWIFYFTYCLFLRPREDGSGVGGSVYWVVDMTEKLCFGGGIMTLLLFWATGQWERGVRWPRRWIHITNRGLRGMNCKIVILKGPWYKEFISHLSFLLPYSLIFPNPSGSYHYIELPASEKRAAAHDHVAALRNVHHAPTGHAYMEEDVAPGGDAIKLLLLPKPFAPDFRENWELYRAAYWERENERRTTLRTKVRAQHRALARQEGGWAWWTGWWRWRRSRGRSNFNIDLERHAHLIAHPTHHRARSSSQSSTQLKHGTRRPSVLRGREREASTSRSPTPSLEGEAEERDRQRRWSSSTTGSQASDRRRR